MTLSSGIVPPSVKPVTAAASTLPLATAGVVLVRLEQLRGAEDLHLDLAAGRRLDVGGELLEVLRRVVRGGNWWLRRIVNSAAERAGGEAERGGGDEAVAQRFGRSAIIHRVSLRRWAVVYRGQATARLLAQPGDVGRGRSRCRPAARRCAAAKRGGSSRTGRRSPCRVSGNSVVFTVCPAFVAVGQDDVGQAAGGQQMRIVEQVLGPADRRERQAGASRKSADSSAARAIGQALARGRAAAPARRCTRWLLVASVGSALRSAKPSTSQKVANCASLTAARKICSPSCDREHVVDRPRVVARGHRLRDGGRSSRTAACAGPSGTRCSRTAPTAPPCPCR